MDKKYSKVNVVIGEKQELTEEQQNCDVLCVTMFKDEKDKKIADLEAKLAESEEMLKITHKALERRNKERQEYISKYRYWKSECYELKQQLAEKEKEIKEVMGNVVGLAKSREIIALEKVQRFIDDEIEIPNDIGALVLADFFNKEIEKIKTSETYVSYEQSQNQTAIAELEKALNNINYNTNCTNEGCVPYDEIEETIDQQIKELKGEK